MNHLFSTTDPTYNYYESELQARTPKEKVFVIFNYLLPGILITLLINVKSVVNYLSQLFDTSIEQYQYYIVVFVALGWHLCYPLYVLKVKRKYTWKAIAQTLSLHRFSVKGFFLLTPLFFILVLVIAVPYMRYVFPVLNQFLQQIPLLQIPEHSIFHDYETLYEFSPWQIALLLIGNFLGEEVYFRGYLMKRSAFLGKHNWWIHSLLFTIYHLWQIPMTYALGFISLAFGLYMSWRKNLYELILLHILINLLLPTVVQLVFYS
ncbi:MAG: CPBP family intramembrane glutamic endopeptidase [Bacteroidota bacterium]